MATGVGMSACCLSGSIHEGSPKGKVETVSELPTYVTAPENGSKAKTIIFLVDVFGWEFKNVRLLADNYAKAGFYCYIPDIQKGDPLPLDFLNSIEPPLRVREQQTIIDKTKNTATVSTTLYPWLFKHSESVTKPIISSFISAVRAIPGTGKIGAIGFCWGGRYTILAAHGEVDAAYACHPSLLAVPADTDPVTRPLSIALGDHDSLVGRDTMGKIQDSLAKKMDVPHEIRIYEGQVHGFALRSDWSSEKDKKAMDDAEAQGIAWFNKYLA